ncbi:MAG: NAD(P)H-hydrate dehydratase [Methanocorpusculum sp.]|nr:NAD(P)H-hydrate dehydratase [Methanocorpusculum sp.]
MKEFAEFGLSGVVSAECMRAVDKNADACGISPRERMESAGTQLANAVRMEHAASVLFLCGPGNNGGDGYAAARHLAGEMAVSVISFGAKTPESSAAFASLAASEAKVISVQCEADFPDITGYAVIVDCLFGTGAHLPLPPLYALAVARMNAAPARVLACDVPSPGARSDRVIAFHLAKTEGAEVYGIGIPLAAEVFCGAGDLLSVQKKSSASHKGAGGTVLVIGGGPYQGAPFLAGEAALRAGADIVRVATPARGFMPDIIIEQLDGARIGREHAERLTALAQTADAVIAGPGLGSDEETLAVVREVVAASRRAVVDADLLRRPLPRAKELTIYTPHAGEFARCFAPVPADLAERGRAVRAAAREAGGVVVLKGAVDVVSDGVRVKFNPGGAPSMTTGGTGDVLAGLCGGLLARTGAFDAACAAVYAAGKAGEAVDAEVGDGLTASDLLRKIAGVLYGCYMSGT